MAFLCVLVSATPSPGLAGPWQENDASRVRLISPWDQAPRSGEVVLGLEFRLEPGWHVYWKNSGDAGYPPALDFGPTPAVRDAELLWPTPERYDLRGGLVAFGYHDHVVYPVRVTWDAAEGDVLEVAADLDYVVCEVDCIPYSYRVTLEQPLAGAGAEPRRGVGEAELLDGFLARVPAAVEARPGVASRGRIDLTDLEAPVLHVDLEGVEPGETPNLFLEPQDTFDVGRPEVTASADRTLRFAVPLSFRETPDDLPERIDLAWTVTGLGAPVDALEARRSVPLETGSSGATRRTGGPAAPTSLWSALGWALLGGLLLHWTPPLLAILLAQIATWRRLPRDLVRRRAAATALGIWVGAGLVVALAYAAGYGLFWGAQFQEPVLLGFLAVAALVVTVNLWGLTDLPLTARRGGGLVAGVAVAWLGLPWDVPFLGQPFAPSTAGFAAFALVLGWSLPYLLLALRPGWIARGDAQPDPMDPRLRPGLGFLAAATLLWLVFLLRSHLSTEGLALLQLGLLGLGLLFWGRRRLRSRLASAACGLLALGLAVWILRMVQDFQVP